jgi:hypothetical protein
MGSPMLQLVRQVTGELGLVVPVSVAGNPSQDAQQILALMNAVGNETVPKFNWQQLEREYRFTTKFITPTGDITAGSPIVTNLTSTAGVVAGQWMVSGVGVNQDTEVLSVDSPTQITMTQPAAETATGALICIAQTKYPLPADWDHPINRTQWDKSKHWEMQGPETPQQWQWLKSGYIATGPRIRFRILGSFFQIWPMLNTAEYLGFEYVSRSWAAAADGTPKTAFTADSDTCIFSDRTMVLGAKLKYMETKGFDTTAILQDFERELELRMGLDQGAPMLSMSPRPSQILIDQGQIPDSGYGVSQ